VTESNRMPWGGRFRGPPAGELIRLTGSALSDLRLLAYDAAATVAHARALSKVGLLSDQDVRAVGEVCDELAVGDGPQPAPEDEDVHSMVERILTERLGEVGRRIHAGRSRNDLVAADLRMWSRDAAARLTDLTSNLIFQIADLADEHAETAMPGYTHLQRAQPVSLGFHLLAHGFALIRDATRFENSLAAANVSPLGAGALAGTTLDIDPVALAQELGFAGSFDNAMDATSDRDFSCDLAYAAAMCGVHLSRLAEEIVLWTSAEFSFASLSDAWSTGSSMMPQKRNADPAELVRGRAAGGIGDLVGLLTILKGLPLAYGRDLQEGKDALFATVDRVASSLELMGHALDALRFDTERMAATARGGALWATDLAEVLVGRGVPFRDAHVAVGSLVAALEARRVDLREATLEVLRSHHPSFEEHDLEVADPQRALNARAGPGGPSADQTRAQARTLRERAEAARRNVTSGDWRR
jgi:argininosuccinate lyase